MNMPNFRFNLFRRPIFSVLLALSLGFALALGLFALPNQANSAQSGIVVMAAGDIACAPGSKYFNNGKGKDGNCQMQATAALIDKVKPQVVLALGDNQYEKGELENFQKSYDPTWGKFKKITKPVPGNHEYASGNANGYYDYFGALAGERNKGYYSFNLGDWHLIALNSECKNVGGCGTGSPQEQWLKADLKANKKACTLAFWHRPRFSSGLHGNNKEFEVFWADLYAARADLVLSGHDHTYERFAPQGLTENLDTQRGIRQFVAGAGGKNLYPFKTVRPNSEVRSDDTYGVLKLTLKPKSYDWEYLAIPGVNFTDKGSANCY